MEGSGVGSAGCVVHIRHDNTHTHTHTPHGFAPFTLVAFITSSINVVKGLVKLNIRRTLGTFSRYIF